MGGKVLVRWIQVVEFDLHHMLSLHESVGGGGGGNPCSLWQWVWQANYRKCDTGILYFSQILTVVNTSY